VSKAIEDAGKNPSKIMTERRANERFKVRRAWHAWGSCWALLHKPMEYGDNPSRAEGQGIRGAGADGQGGRGAGGQGHSAPPHFQVVWNERADLVKKEMCTFVKLHIDACGMTEGLYLHILHAHAHEQIKKWGDLRVRQTQGLEHAHKIRKRIGLNATNRKKGQRLETMLMYKQVLQHLIRWQKSDSVFNLHAKKKKALLARTHAKMLRENKKKGPGWLSTSLTPLNYLVQRNTDGSEKSAREQYMKERAKRATVVERNKLKRAKYS
jgi:hypothetical protein